MLVLVTGPIGVGKTALCRHLAAAAQARGVAVGGVLAPLIPLLARPRCASTVVIVRDSLLDLLRARLIPVQPAVVRLTLSSRGTAQAALEALSFADDGRGEGGATDDGPTDEGKAHRRAVYKDVQC